MGGDIGGDGVQQTKVGRNKTANNVSTPRRLAFNWSQSSR